MSATTDGYDRSRLPKLPVGSRPESAIERHWVRARKRAFVVATLGRNAHPTVMHAITAYERREALSDDDLVRLRSALVGEVERYRVAIRGYSPDKMREHGVPFLAKLEGRVEEVSRILTSRGADRT